VALAAQQKQDLDSLLISEGNKALQLMQKFLSGRATRQEFLAGLAKIDSNIESIVPDWWESLVSDPALVPHWQVLQTLKGMLEELEYQFGEYGESTLFEDMKEIALSLKRIAGG